MCGTAGFEIAGRGVLFDIPVPARERKHFIEESLGIHPVSDVAGVVRASRLDGISFEEMWTAVRSLLAPAGAS